MDHVVHVDSVNLTARTHRVADTMMPIHVLHLCRFEIKGARGLPMACSLAYCEYQWIDGEIYTTDAVEPATPRAPKPQDDLALDYKYMHHVDCMTEDMVARLGAPLRVTLHISPAIQEASPPLVSTDPLVRRCFKAAFGMSADTGRTPPSPTRTLGSLQTMHVAGIADAPVTLAPEEVNLMRPPTATAPVGAISHNGEQQCHTAAGSVSATSGCEHCAQLQMEVAMLRDENEQLKHQLSLAAVAMHTQLPTAGVVAQLQHSIRAEGGHNAASGSAWNGPSNEIPSSGHNSIPRAKLVEAKLLDQTNAQND